MARNSNDDRSDSKNSNNPAYWASESNRSNQIGDDDDDDQVGPTFTPTVRRAMPAQSVERKDDSLDEVVCPVITPYQVDEREAEALRVLVDAIQRSV